MKMAKTKQVYISVCVGSEGDTECFLLTKRQFNGMSNASDPLQWIIDGGEKRDKGLKKFDSVKDLFAHIRANNLEVVEEINGLLY
ncbi:hypothetical protein HU675_0038620 [Bradyrhizobium septentrionale]|uniref:hypothetical protein n=1 Tax=Bradyrhizobium septentrionale TaxID=1404411 RepID=UPI0015964B7E|nr:hypothetical protein [Bradyrhizobium septentrionale]UGY23801.1 hypothetical protein HU675_0038620 [Bradyrhizobium septentrionale]